MLNKEQDSARNELRQLFDAAAAKSLAVVCNLDAEPEMARFVEFVKQNPALQEDVVRLIVESFSDDFYMSWAPVDLCEYCVHAFRWPELREFILANRKADIDRRGAGCSAVWNDILEAFEDDWINAQYYEAFKGDHQ